MIAWLQRYALAGLGVLLALALAGLAVQSIRLAGSQAEKSAIVAQHDREARERAELAREAEILARRQGDTMARNVQEAQRARETEIAASGRTADRLRVERDGLRLEIAAYASGRPDDSAAAGRDRAAALGVLLDDALRVAAACTDGAEQHATDVRTLLRGWPVMPAR